MPIDRSEFRRVLRSRREELSQESALDGVETIELDQTRVGRLSRAEAMQDHQMALEIARRRSAMLEAIDDALRRVDSDPDFGHCDECGEPIATQRLALDPSQRCCVSCQHIREQNR
ncbi:MAG TPA: hypothetical protein DHW07_06825 [Gammaproteobacteria bacterium]|nr:hypothetical protein [Gammaproteobacteria bacterium]|tara:strand:+ start:546 stop:893 length:348 start_codon:yes stop_codon:yes gene_type:complete